MHEFEEMYRRHYPDVYRFALFLTGDAHGAEDLTADTFVRAWTARERLRHESVRSYLFTITRNLYRDQFRRARPVADIVDAIPDRAPAPDQQVDHARTLDRVHRHLDNVATGDRRALILYAVGEMSYQQIARSLGITIGAVKSRIARARAALSALMAPQAENGK